MKCTFKINTFEGPLDLLLHLININEVEITEIPIFEITKQYMEYIESFNDLDLDLASEFILMASELLEIKSKMLLPDPKYDTEEFNEAIDDPREDLVNKLLEYKKFKNAANILDERFNDFGRIHFKEQEDLTPFIKKVPLEELNKDLEKDLLVNAMKRILSKIDRTDEGRENYFEKVKRDAFTVENKIIMIQQRLKEELKFEFSSLFSNQVSKNEVIVTFMALLELLKLNEITVVQEYMFDDIIIEGRNV